MYADIPEKHFLSLTHTAVTLNISVFECEDPEKRENNIYQAAEHLISITPSISFIFLHSNQKHQHDNI